jgi:hypothetical protein
MVYRDMDDLNYGTRAGVIEDRWGKPDEAMAFADYIAFGYPSGPGAGGWWGPYRGPASGYPLRTKVTSILPCRYFMFCLESVNTPTTVVWIYREKRIALFFGQRTVPGEAFLFSPITVVSWKLTGWENLQSEKASLDGARSGLNETAYKRRNGTGIRFDSGMK